MMKTILKIEELFMVFLGLYLFSLLNLSWWWFLACILLPDIGMIGYLLNSKIGALLYNMFHHKGIAIALYLCGLYFESNNVKFVGIILFTHASLDRVLGYGLKYNDAFKYTHLGKIG